MTSTVYAADKVKELAPASSFNVAKTPLLQDADSQSGSCSWAGKPRVAWWDMIGVHIFLFGHSKKQACHPKNGSFGFLFGTFEGPKIGQALSIAIVSYGIGVKYPDRIPTPVEGSVKSAQCPGGMNLQNDAKIQMCLLLVTASCHTVLSFGGAE